MSVRSLHAFVDDALGAHDAVGLAAAIRSRSVHPNEVLAAAIERARRVDPELAAIAADCFDAAAPPSGPAARGPFAGVPTFIKDAIDVAGLPTRHGTAALDLVGPARETGAIAQEMFDMGMVCLGKSSLPEFGLTASTEFPVKPATRNPWNLDHSAGGSSGGAAALVAAGVVPIAHAGDGGGSIRIPAAACGLVGLKPSRGRLLANRKSKFLPVKIITDGVVTRSVRDTAAYHAEVERRHRAPGLAPIGDVNRPLERPLRIAAAIETPGKGEVDDATRREFAATLRLLEDLGHQVEPVPLPVDARFAADFVHFWAMMAFAVARFGPQLVHPDFDPSKLTDLTTGLARQFRGNLTATPGAVLRLRASSAVSERFFARYDVLVTPTVCHLPPPIGHLSTALPCDVLFPRVERWAGFSAWANATGAPSISLPLGFDAPANLPIGMMFGAGLGRERLLLELALQLESACPWRSLDRRAG